MTVILTQAGLFDKISPVSKEKWRTSFALIQFERATTFWSKVWQNTSTSYTLGHRCFPFNSLTKELLPIDESSDLLTCSHKGIIRVGNFDSTGTTFVSGGDDKSVKAWDVENWKCLGTRYPFIHWDCVHCCRHTGKKISGVAFCDDNVIWSDRSGTIFQVPLGMFETRRVLKLRQTWQFWKGSERFGWCICASWPLFMGHCDGA